MKKIIDEIIKGKDFNKLTDQQMEKFIEMFLKLNNSDKMNIVLMSLIEEIDEQFLLVGNYKKLFDLEGVHKLLKSVV